MHLFHSDNGLFWALVATALFWAMIIFLIVIPGWIATYIVVTLASIFVMGASWLLYLIW